MMALAWMFAAISAIAQEQSKSVKSFSTAKTANASSARHDPPEMLFRRAPMSVAPRSVVINLSSNLHLAFDTELLRTHTVWRGEPLNLWGAVYHGGKDKFYCDFDGTVLWAMPPVFPWAVGKEPLKTFGTGLPVGARFIGVSTKQQSSTMIYELPLPGGKSVRVHETATRPAKMNAGEGFIRRFEIGPCSEDLYYLALVTTNKILPRAPDTAPAWVSSADRTDMIKVRTTDRAWQNEHASSLLQFDELDLSYEAKSWFETKGESSVTRTQVSGRKTCGLVYIPAHASDIAVEVATFAFANEQDVNKAGGKSFEHPMKPPQMALLHSNQKGSVAPPIKVFSADLSVPLASASDDYFRVEHFPLPKEIQLQVTGMDFLPNGDLAVCTWLGEVYIVQHPQGDVQSATYRRFARGLCEPGGLKVINGQIYVVQKQELTRLVDTDGNGECDLYECVNQGWGFTGNYHDFSFGPVVDAAGNFHVYRTGTHGVYDIPYMGWDVQISADGKALSGFCSGLRSPNGFGTYGSDRALFMTDNQGNWIGACTLNHIQRGKFYGYPSTIPAPKEDFLGPRDGRFTPPAVWFPYTLAKSASGFVTINDDRFGAAFKGQMLVGDFQNAIVMRVALEKVNGEWQGAVWPLLKGFGSGVNRLAMGPDGKLYVGGCKNRAWAAVAPRDYSLDRVSFTGKVPFEVNECHARPDGFELTFTQPVDPATAGNPDSYDVAQFKYKFHSKYGSPEIDHDGKENSSTPIKVVSAKVSAAGLTARLKLEGWKPGYVTLVRGLDVRSAGGKKLWHDTFHYTLNQIPKEQLDQR